MLSSTIQYIYSIAIGTNTTVICTITVVKKMTHTMLILERCNYAPIF